MHRVNDRLLQTFIHLPPRRSRLIFDLDSTVVITNMSLTPAGIWHFYDGRAGMEPRIRELREDFALRKIPTASFAANALYLEIVRLAYNLVTAFQRNSSGLCEKHAIKTPKNLQPGPGYLPKNLAV
jgi:hypothetical protein